MGLSLVKTWVLRCTLLFILGLMVAACGGGKGPGGTPPDTKSDRENIGNITSPGTWNQEEYIVSVEEEEPVSPPTSILDDDGDGDPNETDCAPDNANIHSAAKELCDEVDNDCDGVVDEGFPDLGKECSDGIGACHRVGKIICSMDGTATVCPLDEMIVDPGVETCDGIDNDCDGVVDNHLTPPAAGLTAGVCQGQVKTCSGAQGWSEPNYAAIKNYAAEEICDDELDNNCNGEVDEGCVKPPKPGVTEGLVGHWTFDEGEGTAANDSTENANHGTLKGTLDWSEGLFGKAITFSGDDYVDAGPAPALNLTREISISLWFKTGQSQFGTLVNKYNNGRVNKGYLLHIGNDGWAASSKITFRVDNAEAEEATTTKDFTDNKWHHVVAVHKTDGSRLQIFVDGIEEAVTRTGSTIRQVGDAGSLFPFRIGQYSPGGYNFHFKGEMDDVRIYNRVLTQEEITKLATKPEPRPISDDDDKDGDPNDTDCAPADPKINRAAMELCDDELDNNCDGEVNEGCVKTPEPGVASENLVGHWTLDEAEGTLAADATANKNDGTLINNPQRVDGVSGKALSFGGQEYVEVKDSSSLNVTPEITISLHFKTNKSQFGMLANKFNNGPNLGYLLHMGGAGWGEAKGSLAFSVYNRAGHILVTNRAFNDDQWHHVIAVYKADGLSDPKIYVDGSEEAEAGSKVGGRLRGIGDASGFPLRIGQYSPSGHNFSFKGSIDDVRIYNKALELEEIKALFVKEPMPKPESLLFRSIP